MEMYNPPHPGELLKNEILDYLDLTIVDAARHLGITRKTLSKIIHGRGAITPEMAVRLELAFKKPTAEHWLRMQNAYDLWHIQQRPPQVAPFQSAAA